MTNEQWLAEAKELYPGWYNIIQRLDKHMNVIFASGYTIDQIKEKFGTLRFYWTAPAGARTMDLKDAQISVTNVERESARTCMQCGEAGTLHADVGWHCTLCELCFALQYPLQTKDIDDNIA